MRRIRFKAKNHIPYSALVRHHMRILPTTRWENQCIIYVFQVKSNRRHSVYDRMMNPIFGTLYANKFSCIPSFGHRIKNVVPTPEEEPPPPWSDFSIRKVDDLIYLNKMHAIWFIYSYFATTDSATGISVLPTQTALRQWVALVLLPFLIIWLSPKDYTVTAMFLHQTFMLFLWLQPW